MFKNMVGFLLLIFITSDVLASDAFVFAEEDFGQGFFRQRGNECFFITAGHVVKDATEIELVTAERYRLRATVMTSYPDDVAILRVELPANNTCPKSSWDSGGKLKILLGMEQEGIVKTRLDDGSTVQTPVSIKTFDGYRYIQIVPKNPKDKFRKGFSGSPLFIAGELAGMLQSVSNGVGKVFRQDALNNTISLFFNDKKQITRVPKDNNESNVKPPTKVITSTSTSSAVFKGSISKGQTIEHNFQGVTNSPVLFTTVKTQSVRYLTQIYQGKKLVYKNKYDSTRATEHVFTPKKDTTYTLKFIGTAGHGEYSVSMEPIATSSDLTGKANVISVGNAVEGRIAKDAIAEYRFKGVANSPVLFTTVKTQSVRYLTQIYQGKKLVYKNKYDSTRATEHVFTPKKNATYTLKFIGTAGHGEYSVSMEKR